MMEGLSSTTGSSSSSLGLAAAAAASAAAAAAAADDDLLGTIKGIGVMGSLLYTAMLCLVGWRTHAFFRGGGDGTPAGVFPAKAFFHLFLLASCLSDLPYYYKVRGGLVWDGIKMRLADWLGGAIPRPPAVGPNRPTNQSINQ